jgi:hypothetical protein
MICGVLLFVGFIRVRLLDMPLERDEGEYAYAGQLILQGVPPYELAYNMKLPGTYLAYALGMALFGQTIAGVHLTLIVANSLTVFFVFLLGRKLSGVTAGLVSCASYGVMSVCPEVMGMAAHANHFVVLFAVPATLLLLQADENRENRTLFWSGLLYGLAFLMKQQGICFGLFGWFFLVWRAAQNGSLFSTSFAKKSFAFGSGAVFLFGLTCLAAAWAGAFSKFWFWTFTYAGTYVASLPFEEGVERLVTYLKNTFVLFSGFWLVSLAGLPFALLNKSARGRAMFVISFGVCALLGTAVGLYFRPHYFILVLPACAILLGMAVVSLQQALRFGVIENVFKSLPPMLFVTALAWVIFYDSRYFFQLSGAGICKTLYSRNPFVESLDVARYIREHTAADTRIAIIGSEPEIYFYARRRSATGYLYTYALMESQPNALTMQREMMREIELGRPEYMAYVVYYFSWMFRPHSDRAIIRWFEQYAGRFYEQVGVVYLKDDGNVECLWGGAQTNYSNPSGQYIAIYKRKPAPETIPAGSN